MTYAELQMLLIRVTYKPNFKFQAYRQANVDSIRVSLAAQLPDARDTEGQIVTIHSCLDISEPTLLGYTQSQVLEYLCKLILDFEKHEADEWFKLDGVQVNDPHKIKVVRNTVNNLRIAYA